MKKKEKKDDIYPGVTVVVPLHNEEECLLATLEALAIQEYKGPWEVICINDRSTDNTLPMLEEFCAKHENFSVDSVPMDAPPLESPKKRALDVGFSHSKYDILMTMDADCIPPKTWIASMASDFQGDVAIVQGSKCINGGGSLVHRYQKLETLGLTLIEAAGFTMKRPVLASAAALAYKKELYYKVGGFNDLMDYASGDDDMLVHKMASEPVDYCYNSDPGAMILTEPVNTFKELLNQHSRWASNGTNYTSKLYVLHLFLIYLFYVWLLAGPLLIATGWIHWTEFVIPLGIKTLMDFSFLFIGGKKLGCAHFTKDILLTELIQIPLIVLSVIGGQLKMFKWK